MALFTIYDSDCAYYKCTVRVIISFHHGKFLAPVRNLERHPRHNQQKSRFSLFLSTILIDVY